MILNHHKSVHITLFKEKESFSKRSLSNNILLIFNNLTVFIIFLKIHAQFFNLSLLLTNIFVFSLKFYYKYNINFNLNFYKHYFFAYFNNFFDKLILQSMKIKNLLNLFFIKFFNKIKKINNNFNKKLFILYNFNVFLIGNNYNVYTGNIIPFYQKKLMWFIGTGLKLDGECSESILSTDSFNQLIWSNFNKNSIIKIQNFNINLKGFNIHKRLKHYYYLYLSFNYKYIKQQKQAILKKNLKFYKLNYLYYYNFFFYKKKNYNNINNLIYKKKQIKFFIYNFFINLLKSLILIFKLFFHFLNIENKKINLFFYFLNSYFIYLKSISLFIKILKLIKVNYSDIFFKNLYSVNLLNLFFFKIFFENQKLYFFFFNFYNKKKIKIRKKKKNKLFKIIK